MNRSTQHAFDPEEVMAYLDGELNPHMAAKLAAHLEHCDECRALAAQLRQLSERLLDFEAEPMPERVSEMVLNSLQTTQPEEKKREGSAINQRPKWRLLLMSPYTWGLAGLVIVVSIIVVGVPNALRLPGGTRESGQHMVDLYRAEPQMSAATVPNAAPVPKAIPDTAGDTDENLVPGAVVPPAPEGKLAAPESVRPMIAQTVSLTILAANYDEASAAIDRLAASQGGYVQKLTAEAQTGSPRQFSATLRIPANQLGGFLAEVRKLGHVEEESRADDEVTDQYVDLEARLRSARASEQRLLELLGTRTGKLEDVLDAERELARIREEIESMDGQRVLLLHRVNYATVEVQLQEEYRERLSSESSSTRTKISNAAVEGFGNLADGIIVILLFLLEYGLSILVWLAIILVPGWFVWRRFRARRSVGS
jgi:anti-sigma factor RsiW